MVRCLRPVSPVLRLPADAVFSELLVLIGMAAAGWVFRRRLFYEGGMLWRRVFRGVFWR